MSHFTVLVIGNDPEKLLAPFDEGIETEPYEDEELRPADALAWAKKVLDDPSILTDSWRKPDPYEIEKQLAEYRVWVEFDPANEDDAAKLLAWYGGYTSKDYIRKEDGRYVRMSRYNPDSKWDWYSLGGRWRGSLKVTPEAWDRMTKQQTNGLGEVSWVFNPEWNDGHVHSDEPMWVDQCRRGDLDLQGMIDKKVATGREAVTELIEFIAQHGSPPDASWLDAGLEGDELVAARDAYWKHPWMKANAELARAQRDSKATVGMMGWWELEDLRLVTENVDGAERYIERQAQRAVPGYAFLDEEHGWVEPGRMGWWGMSSDTAESRAKYYEERLAVLKAVPDDVLVSVYDCHI